MLRVFVPPFLKSQIPNTAVIELEAKTVDGIISQLDERFPGVRDRICVGDRLQPGLAVALNGRVATLGLLQKVEPNSEIHFILAIGGG